MRPYCAANCAIDDRPSSVRRCPSTPNRDVDYQVAALFSVPANRTRMMTISAGSMNWTLHALSVSHQNSIGGGRTRHYPSGNDAGDLSNGQHHGLRHSTSTGSRIRQRFRN
jgi:hypothetical protein